MTEHDSHTGIFGLPVERERALVRILPVPFEATCSYGRGTADGPAAILRASTQLDLHDPDFGPIYRCGIHLEEAPEEIVRLDGEARPLAEAVMTGDRSSAASKQVNELSLRRSEIVETWTRETLADGRVPGILGGDHSCPLGAIRALAVDCAFSILQVDAHLDLRAAYQGFTESHASIMHNVLEACAGVERVVAVGVRDFDEGELDRARSEPDRVIALTMNAWDRRLMAGETFQSIVDESLQLLGERVYVSFDIDGLDPSLCPHAGTPVPGGLSYPQASYLLHALAVSGRRLVGFDLCEVVGRAGDGATPAAEFDANVGARILYKLCGVASASQLAQ